LKLFFLYSVHFKKQQDYASVQRNICIVISVKSGSSGTVWLLTVTHETGGSNITKNIFASSSMFLLSCLVSVDGQCLCCKFYRLFYWIYILFCTPNSTFRMYAVFFIFLGKHSSHLCLF